MKMKKIEKILLLAALMFAPAAAFAQQAQNLSQLATLAIKYFNVGIYLIIALAIVVFVWNVYIYFFTGDSTNKKEAGLYVMYSVIGLFVILSFWGLVNIVTNTLNLNNNVPSLNFFGASGSSLNSGTFGSLGNSSSGSFGSPGNNGNSNGSLGNSSGSSGSLGNSGNSNGSLGNNTAPNQNASIGSPGYVTPIPAP